MCAPECIPLVMEPESRFYTAPIVVLDFQSLYPSMIIAYNYCFSTCLGRVSRLNEYVETITVARKLRQVFLLRNPNLIEILINCRTIWKRQCKFFRNFQMFVKPFPKFHLFPEFVASNCILSFGIG